MTGRTTTKNNTNPRREAATAMLKAGTASLSEVAALAGVSKQLATYWTQIESGGKRTRAFDWQAKRAAYLEKHWRRQMAKFSAVSALRE